MQIFEHDLNTLRKMPVPQIGEIPELQGEKLYPERGMVEIIPIVKTIVLCVFNSFGLKVDIVFSDHPYKINIRVWKIIPPTESLYSGYQHLIWTFPLL